MVSAVKEKMAAGGKTAYALVETPEGLGEAATALAREDRLACDLEADSMFHYREKVCLVQLGNGTGNFIVDPLQVKDLSSLKPIFSNRRIQKIFHGADYDIRSLYRDFGIVVRNLFDTQIAARFLGYTETGLEAVLSKKFNLKLDKKYQKKDWSRRPLPSEMIAYAAGDVIHLSTLARTLEAELDKLGRRQWVEEECELLSRVRPAEENGEPLFLRFKGAGRFSPRGLAVLEALLQYRRAMAEKKDRPLFKVLGNDSLVKIAKARPVTIKRLEGIRALSRKQIDMYGAPLVEEVEKALSIPESQLPTYPRKRQPRMPADVPKRIKALKKWRDPLAERLNIDPAILCSKALLTAIAVRNPSRTIDLNEIAEMRQWQRKEFGPAIISALKRSSSPE